jgi:eukaryotic-like serine/threonine-protein kinase
MNQASIQHFSNQQLIHLLDGEIGQRRELEFTSHIGECETCRKAFENIAAENNWWERISNKLSEHSQGDESRRRRRRETNQRPEQSSSTPLKLDFLSASDNPAMLGRLGEYEILEVLGAGGMGIVLKGYDYELNRYVAVKVLAPHLTQSGLARKRFIRESQAAAAILHPSVVPIFSVSAESEVPFFVMAYIPGETLQQRIDREGTLEGIDILRIALQIAEGLDAAHAQGLIHRDVKPSNILLERNVDRAMIVDFGLVRSCDETTLTQISTISGTPEYMSPEQARGEVVDARTDIYSLGSVMFAMATGTPPHRAESPLAVLRKLIDNDAQDVLAINNLIPAYVSDLIKMLLIREKDSRIGTMSQVADLLRQTLAHVQQPSVNPVPGSLIRGSLNQKRLIKLSVATCIVLTASFVALLLWTPNDGDGSADFSKDPVNQIFANSTSNELDKASVTDLLALIKSEPSSGKVVAPVEAFLKCVKWDDQSQSLKLTVDYTEAESAYKSAYAAVYMAEAEQSEIRNKRRDTIGAAKSGLAIPGFDLNVQEQKQADTHRLIEGLKALERQLDHIAHQFDASDGKW